MIMKTFMLVVALVVTSATSTAMAIDLCKECFYCDERVNESVHFLKITKSNPNPKNYLRYAVKLDNDCQIVGNKVISYWKMDDISSARDICADPTKREAKYYEAKEISRLSSNSLEFTLGFMEMMYDKFPVSEGYPRIDEMLRVQSSQNSDGSCAVKGHSLIDGEDKNIASVHTDITWTFSLKKLTFKGENDDGTPYRLVMKR